MDGDVTLWVPARSGYVHLVRTVAAGLAAHLDLDVDAIEDLRLATTEAASLLLAVLPGARAEPRTSFRSGPGRPDGIRPRSDDGAQARWMATSPSGSRLDRDTCTS